MNKLKSLLLLIILALILSQCEREDKVKITDKVFLKTLIELGVDADGSGKISYQEAEAITRLAINNKSIRNLDGIEAFINLELLDCTNDFLKSIDVSNNYALTDLYLGGNLLTSLDVSNNPALKIFGMWRK